MKKVTIITGEIGSGKTLMAKELASKHRKEDVMFLKGRQFNPQNQFRFSGANKNTRMIVIDDVDVFYHIEYISFLNSYDTIDINVRNGKPIIINTPDFIVTCDESITKKFLETFGQSFQRRVKIIEITK